MMRHRASGRDDVRHRPRAFAMTRAVMVALPLVILAAPLAAQQTRPRAEVTPSAESTTVSAGSTAHLMLKVRLPEHVHVQAHEPRDPSLIPTVLTVEAPAGITVEAVTYPPPTELTQAGRREPLAVLGPEFAIDVRLQVAATASAGERLVPAVLRYQACNDTVCFPPTRASTEWRLTIVGR
jgi:DsbC/DsbD-like thiol-disulfide interchange protein